MCPNELTAAITALANIMAEGKSSNEIALLGAVLNQLGDTLATISAQMDFCEKRTDAGIE